MIRRFRILGALLALGALSAFVADGVWSSFCPSAANGHPVTASEAAHGGQGEAAHHAPAEQTTRGDPSGDEGSHCPLGMAAGATCSASLLPAIAIALAFPLPDQAGGAFMVDATRDRLLAANHFRPPRA